jgi:hypothetical protein
MFHADHDTDTPPPITPNPPSRPTAAAANALKHGFRASKYLDPAILACAEAIRADLVSIHDPDSDEETDILEDLAIARARYDAIQRSFDSDHAHNRKHARKAFEDQLRKRLNDDIDKLPKFPLLHFEPIGQNYQGARWIVGKWAEVVRSLGPDRPGMTFDQAMFACFALASTWKIPRMNASGAWVMTRFVRQSLEPGVELKRWVELTGGPTDESLARWYLDRSPNPAQSRQELLTRAQSELDRWTLRLNELRPDYETDAATAADRVLPGMPASHDQPDRLRIPVRYLSEARGQVDRLQRRLDAVKKSRTMNRHRIARKAEREAQRELRESAVTPATQTETTPVATHDRSTEATLNEDITSISANELSASDRLPLEVEPIHETAVSQAIPAPATAREDTTFEFPGEVNPVPDAPELPSAEADDDNTELGDVTNAEADNAETGIEAWFDFDFDDDAETVLDIDFEAAAEAQAKARYDAGDASGEPIANDSQDESESEDTPISPNGRAALPAVDRELFDRVSDPRIPLSDRIAWLAERLGVTFESDPGFEEDEDDDDPTMTPEERREFEAWKTGMLKWQRGEGPPA